MSNFNLRPIPKEIRYKLLQKQKAFARQSITEATSANKSLELGDDFLQFHNRATWAHMIGLTVIPGEDEKERIAIIGAGELNQEPAANEPLMKSSFDSIYSPLKDNKNTLYRPISGIKSISTRYEGDIKSRRECTVNFTVFSLEDLDRLSPYFFRVGSEVLVEFGWNQATDTASSMFNTSLGHKIIDIYNEKGVSGFTNSSIVDLLKNNTAENYEKEILTHNGDYEYVLGKISNFEYSLRADGGFDCVVKIQTVGMSLLDTKVNRERSPTPRSAETKGKERKIENTSPDEVSDEFYLMMDNLPEIIFGSLIQGYGDTHDKKPPDPDKDKKPANNGINIIAAAWYLMGGSSPSDHHLHKETQQFALIWLTWAAVYPSQKHWTTNKPLVSVYQEALMEQGHDLPAFGPDGHFSKSDGSMSETEKAGMDFMKKFNKGGVEYPDDFIKRTKQDFSTGPVSGNEALTLYFEPREEGSKNLFFTRMDNIRKNIHNKDKFKSNERVTEDSIEFLSTGTDSRRKKFNNVSPKYLTSQEDSVSNVEELDIPLAIESKFYINTSMLTERDFESDPRMQSFKGNITEPGFSGKNLTIFTTYRQKNTTQIFTGFNWGKSKADFNRLSKIYAGETYRDDLKPLGKARAEAKPYATEEDKTLIQKTMEKFGYKPEWEKLPYDPDNPYLSTEDAASMGSPSLATDEFLEFVDPDGKVPPKIWIRWGWFEDNILTRYLGYMPDIDIGGSPVSLFKSVEPKILKQGPNQGTVIAGYESNKIGLPSPLLTTDVNQVIIPDRVTTLEKVTQLKDGKRVGAAKKGEESELETFNFYSALGRFLQEEAAGPEGIGISPVEKPGGGTEGYKVGYIRNLFVEASTLQQAFLNIGTLKEGLDKFIAIMYKNFGKIHKLEVQQGRDDNMVGIVDTNLIYDKAIWKKTPPVIGKLEDEANQIKVFEFPAWEKESIVKNQDLRVTIPNEMAITALYSGNEHMRNLGIYDESRGSTEAQKLSKYLRLNAKGEDIATESVSNRFTRVEPIIKSKKLTISGNGVNETGKHRYIIPDTFLTYLNDELLRSIGKSHHRAKSIEIKKIKVKRTGKDEEILERTSYALDVDEMKSRFVYGFYNFNGTLEEDHPFNMRRLMEYELQYDANYAVQNNYPTINGLLDLSLTIDGTAGIFPGNSYISKYLPKAWQPRTSGTGKGEYPILFQATDVSHEISSDGWNTMITGMPRMNPAAFPYEYAERPRDKDTGENNIYPASLAISKYSNFFNLNFKFASKSLLGDNSILKGINTTGLWDTDDTKTHFGSLEQLGISKFFENDKLTYAGAEDSTTGAMRGGVGEQSKTVNDYADFSKVMDQMESLNFKDVTIPSKPVAQTVPNSRLLDNYAKLGETFVIGEMTFESNVELLLFIQMSMIISGLTYYGLVSGDELGNKIPIGKSVYENMLADHNFEPHRPRSLVKSSGKQTILISKEKIGDDFAYQEYFSMKNDKWHTEIPIQERVFRDSPYGYDGPIYPYIWPKKNHLDTVDGARFGDDVPLDIRLIGPARFTPEGDRHWQGHGVSSQYFPYNHEIKIFEGVFLRILKNEYGIGTWKEFDVIISKALGTPSPEVSVEDLFQNNSDDAPSVDSEKVFNYALDCEYRIKI